MKYHNNAAYFNTHTHTWQTSAEERRLFNGPLAGTTWLGWYQKGKTNLDFTEGRDSEWQWHQLGNMQVCISLQTEGWCVAKTKLTSK